MNTHRPPTSLPGTTNRIESVRALLDDVVANPSTYGLEVCSRVEDGEGRMAVRELLETSHRAARISDTAQEWATLALALGIAEKVFVPASASDEPGANARWFYLWDQLEGASPEAETRRRLEELLQGGAFENHAHARGLFASAATVWSSRTEQGENIEHRTSSIEHRTPDIERRSQRPRTSRFAPDRGTETRPAPT